MIPIHRKSRRAFTLLEMIVVCPLLAVMLSLLGWTLIYHLKLTHGVAAQSHRQEIMYRVLSSFRSDLLEAESVVIENFDSDTPLPEGVVDLPDLPPLPEQTHRTLASRITTSRTGGHVKYYLIADSALIPRSSNSTLTDLPPDYILVRIAPTDAIPVRVWPLRDLRLHVAGALDDGANDDASTLRLTFESRQDLDARAPVRRRFDTTLRAGGAR